MFRAGTSAEDSWDDMQVQAEAPAEEIDETAGEYVIEPEIVQEPKALGPVQDAEETGGDAEPVYDLFELGAVEYIEKT